MGILDLFRGEPKQLVLDVATIGEWPAKLIRHQRLDDSMAKFVQAVDRRRRAVSSAKARLTDQTLHDQLPERAQPIHDEHLPLILESVDRVVESASFIEDIFLLEAQQQDFIKGIAQHRENVQKSIAALKEYYGDELQTLDREIRALEDAVLSASTILEEAGFDSIQQIKELAEEHAKSHGRAERLQQMRSQLVEEVVRLTDKRSRIEERIDRYMERARNTRYQEIFAREAELRTRRDEIQGEAQSSEQAMVQLKTIDDELSLLRKQIITDITAMNISEQRSFLEKTNHELRKTKEQQVRIDQALQEMSVARLLERMQAHLEHFNVRVEDATTIYEDEGEIAPQ